VQASLSREPIRLLRAMWCDEHFSTALGAYVHDHPVGRALSGTSGARRVAMALRVTEPDAAVIARSMIEPEAFARVFDRHWPAIHRFCASRAGAFGEDIAAEVFRVAFDGRDGYDARHPDAGPWLYGIAVNLLRRHFRSAERSRRAEARTGAAHEPDLADAALGRVEARALGPRLTLALETVGAVERDALLLHAWAGLTYDEIARATGSPIGTVRSRSNRARSRMRAHLDTTEEQT
jgi:RNA polymerase sigma factor (sigma-70 family)